MTELNSVKCFSEHKALILILVVNCYLPLPPSSELWPPYFLSYLWGDSHEEAFGLSISLSWSCSSCFLIHLGWYRIQKISQSRWDAVGEKKKDVNQKEMEGNIELLCFFCFFASHPSNRSGQGGGHSTYTTSLSYTMWVCQGATFCYFENFKNTIWYVEKNVSNICNTHPDNAVVFLCMCSFPISFPGLFPQRLALYPICVSLSVSFYF